MRRYTAVFLVAFLFSASALAQSPAPASPMKKNELDRMHFMLLKAYEEVQKNYYDPKYHGVDLTASYHRYDAALDKSPNLNQSFRIIQSFLANLHDSHLYFLPPERSARTNAGYEMELIGDKCLVTRVRPGTDAAAKLHAGDQVLSLDGFKISPKNIDDLLLLVRILSTSPQDDLDIATPQGEQRHVTVIATKLAGQMVGDFTGAALDYDRYVLEGQEEERRERFRFVEFGDTVVWKLPTFETDPPTIDKAVDKVLKKKNIIIDLRGNRGGYIIALSELLAHCFDHEITIGDRITRKNSKPETVKPKGPLLTGKITVLVDHDSDSASELFARVIQLEKRGDVIGDHSGGAVMEAMVYPESYGADYQIFFGFSVTSANIVMTDGKSLEEVGVTPDELLLPTAADIAEGRDPVLSHALAAYGVTLDPAAAGKLFPYEWARLQ